MERPEPFTAVHAIGFVYNAFAHVTDGEQVAEEIVAVVEALEDIHCTKAQISEIYDWYCDVFAVGENEMQKTLNNCVNIIEHSFKKNDPKKIITKRFIDSLVTIAKADGVIKESEKNWVRNFCKILEIEEPKLIIENEKDDRGKENINKALNQTFKKDRPPIIIAIANPNSTIEEIEKILKADPEQIHALDTRDDANGYSALHYACWDGRINLAKLLIENGADINLKGINDGCTPLLLCGTSPNSFQCAKLLLELEAEIENRNLEPNIYHPNGATILRLAVINCCYDLADLLIEKGASLAALTEPCSNKADAIEFFEACRKICPEYYPNLYDTERLDKIFDIVKQSNVKSKDNGKSLKPNKNIPPKVDTGYMALSYKNRSEDENKFLVQFIHKWMAETESYNNVISKIQFPSFLPELDESCPLFTHEEITFINNIIRNEKCIPSLKYIHDPVFYYHTKQVWWLAPCIYWGDKLVSWVMVDKNGFYAPHPDEWADQDNISSIFSWEMVEDVSFDVEKDASENEIAILNLEATNGGELTFYELLNKNNKKSKNKDSAEYRGSYLSVFKSIFDVNHPNILESRGAHNWNHGVGDEGFKGFDNPQDLLNQAYWEEARKGRMNYKTNQLFDFTPDK